MPNQRQVERSLTNPGTGFKRFTKDEALSWQSKLEKCAIRACTPLKFAMANGDDMPMPLEVVRNDRGNVVIHVFRRPDIPIEKGEPVFARALAEVFGPPRPSQIDEKTGQLKDCFFRDEEEIKKQSGFKKKLLESDSWYVEFPDDVSMILPGVEYLRDKLALAVRKHWLSQ